MNIIDEIRFHLGDHPDVFNDNEVFFKKLFLYYFLNNLDLNEEQIDYDDLLFFIFNDYQPDLHYSALKSNNKAAGSKTKIGVFRKSSTDLPISLSPVNWRETLYLNLLLQKIDYSLLFTILTRTSAQHFHVLSKQKIHLFASPSHHSVLYKEKSEEYSYPLINFHVDNYEDFLYDNVLNYLENIYIELLAHLSPSEEPLVLVSFAINYESINNTYQERRSMINGQYLGIVKVKDAITDALGEIVIKKKIKRSVSDCPKHSLFNNNYETIPSVITDLYSNLQYRGIYSSSNHQKHNHRATSAMSYWKYGSSSTTIQDDNNYPTFDSEDLFSTESNWDRDKTVEGNPKDDQPIDQLWYQRGFSQLYFKWKRKQRHVNNSYHCFVTNISIPCKKIIEQIFPNSNLSTGENLERSTLHPSRRSLLII